MPAGTRYYVTGEGPGPVGAATDLGGTLDYRVDAAGNIERRTLFGWRREGVSGFVLLEQETTPLPGVLADTLRYWLTGRHQGDRLSDMVPASVLGRLAGTGYRYFATVDSAQDYAASVAGHLLQEYIPDAPAPAPAPASGGARWTWRDLFGGAGVPPAPAAPAAPAGQVSLPSWLAIAAVGALVLVVLARR